MSNAAVTPINVDRLRRLRILQRLGHVAPSPMGEMALLASLRTDTALSPTIERVRRSLGYLAKQGLVHLITIEESDWLAAHIATDGIAWLSAPGDRGFAIYSPDEVPVAMHKTMRGRVSSVKTLPPEVKAWIDAEIVTRHFSGYTELADLLAAKGYEISRSALGRYGKRAKEEQEELRQSIEMAKAFAEIVGDDGAAMNQTLTALAQQEVMAVLRERRFDADAIKLPALIQSVAQLNRQDIALLKFKVEEAARKKAIEDASACLSAMKDGGGYDEATLDAAIARVYGV